MSAGYRGFLGSPRHLRQMIDWEKCKEEGFPGWLRRAYIKICYNIGQVSVQDNTTKEEVFVLVDLVEHGNFLLGYHHA
jgi:hypothetical protein